MGSTRASTRRPCSTPLFVPNLITIVLAVAVFGLPLLLPSVSSFPIHSTIERTSQCQQSYQLSSRNAITTILARGGRTILWSSALDGADAAQRLPLSKDDLARMNEMKTRGKVVPIVLLDALLPGQRIYFSSADPKFEKLLQYVIRTERDTMSGRRPSVQSSSAIPNKFININGRLPSTTSSFAAEIGILGFHPTTGEPLTFGTTAYIPTKQITYGISRNHDKVIATSFKGHETFQLVGDPWMDPTQSFYLAHVEVLQYRTEIMATQQEIEAERLFCSIPSMIEEWMTMLFTKSITTPAALQQQFKELGPMPPTKKDRAIWVAALLNPIQQQQQNQIWRQRVCQEIRPAMLACQNDHDRLILAAAALQSSVDKMQKQSQA